jgi:hypothetical protein
MCSHDTLYQLYSFNTNKKYLRVPLERLDPRSFLLNFDLSYMFINCAAKSAAALV